MASSMRSGWIPVREPGGLRATHRRTIAPSIGQIEAHCVSSKSLLHLVHDFGLMMGWRSRSTAEIEFVGRTCAQAQHFTHRSLISSAVERPPSRCVKWALDPSPNRSRGGSARRFRPPSADAPRYHAGGPDAHFPDEIGALSPP